MMRIWLAIEYHNSGILNAVQCLFLEDFGRNVEGWKEVWLLLSSQPSTHPNSNVAAFEILSARDLPLQFNAFQYRKLVPSVERYVRFKSLKKERFSSKKYPLN